MKNRIYYAKPSITEREVELATDAARNGWGESCYDYIIRFENMFKKYTGAKYAIATSSCTGALHMGMAALGIGPTDEVILADINWIATAAPITYLGAKPVLVDILSDTWCIDPDKIEASISNKTKAIIAVHLYGNLCEMDRLLYIGEKYNLPIIEDSAEAIGSLWHDKHTGTIGKFGVFSFHGTKTITTGEGGMFTTNDKSLYEKVLTLSNHGRSRTQNKQFWADIIGYKYKMSNIQAAIGCGQMERIEILVNRKREIFKIYQEILKNTNHIKLNPEKAGTTNSFWMPTVVVDRMIDFNREKVIAAFLKANIDVRTFFWPLSSLPAFSDAKRLPVSWDIHSRAINLPSYHEITLSQQEYVGEILINYLLNGLN